MLPRPPHRRRPLATVLVGSMAVLSPVLLALADGEAPPAPARPPDYAFYKERIAPIVHGVCAECHADPRKRLGKHFLRPVFGRSPREADHRKNFETILGLLTPGDPSKSLWLLKPLDARQGGVAHKGGARIQIDGLEYATMIEFINGARLEGATPEAATSEAPRTAPEIPGGGLTLQAEAFAREGDATAVPEEGAEGLVVVPGPGGVRLTHEVTAPEDRSYRITFRVRAGDLLPFAFRVDGGPPVPVTAPQAGFGPVGPAVPCDGDDPLVAPRGRLRAEGEVLQMEGRPKEPAQWLSPWEGDHTAVEAVVSLPGEEEGGDDALLLFDMRDPSNGGYAGLTDAGRRFVIGVIEGGTLRALASAEAPPAEGDRRIQVTYVDGVAVGRLDGRPLVHANLAEALEGRGRFGLLTHGTLQVRGAASLGQYELHRVRFGERPHIALAAGRHTLTVEIPGNGPALDAVTLAEPGR